jgi:hypothetical protein
MGRRVVCHLVANIPNEHSSRPSRYVLLPVRSYKLLFSHCGSHRPWRRRRYVAPKCDETPTTQHGVTSRKTTMRSYWICLITNDSSYAVFSTKYWILCRYMSPLILCCYVTAYFVSLRVTANFVSLHVTANFVSLRVTANFVSLHVTANFVSLRVTANPTDHTACYKYHEF